MIGKSPIVPYLSGCVRVFHFGGGGPMLGYTITTVMREGFLPRLRPHWRVVVFVYGSRIPTEGGGGENASPFPSSREKQNAAKENMSEDTQARRVIDNHEAGIIRSTIYANYILSSPSSFVADFSPCFLSGR